MVKNPPASQELQERHVRSLGWEDPGGGHGSPLQYSCLENSMDRGAWWAQSMSSQKSQMQLKRVSTHILRGKGKTAGRKRTVGELQAHHHCPSLPSPGSSLTPAVSASRPPAGPSPLGPRSCSPLTLLMLISDILDMNKVCSFSRLSCIMV